MKGALDVNFLLLTIFIGQNFDAVWNQPRKI